MINAKMLCSMQILVIFHPLNFWNLKTLRGMFSSRFSGNKFSNNSMEINQI